MPINHTKRACVFAHYDKDGIVDRYVYYYLQKLKLISKEIVFVTVSNISLDDKKHLNEIGVTILQRENVGYDFYSYKVGIDYLKDKEYKELILCNDSVYGPIYSLESVFVQMEKYNVDFWGITSSSMISIHIQSYFIVFREELLSSDFFYSFWENVKPLEDKVQIIKMYEIGLTQFFNNKKFNYCSLINIKEDSFFYKKGMYLIKRMLSAPNKILRFALNPGLYLKNFKRSNHNPVLQSWEDLIKNQKSPFLKTSLFTSNEERNKNILKLKSILDEGNSNLLEIIQLHSKRFNKF